MSGFEHGIADVFAALEQWLISTGATQSMMRLAWAVLTFLWLGHVAVSLRPGGAPDMVGTFGRMFVAGGLLLAIGSLNQIVLLVFGTLRDAGSAVLSGLISQSWAQFKEELLGPHRGLFHLLGQLLGPWITSTPWAPNALLLGILLALLLLAIGSMVYLAILFFAHLTLLLALFLAPLAVALLVAPGTARWTARWAVVIVRTGLVVFCVRVIHAAAIYLAVIVPIREVFAGNASGPGLPGGGAGGIASFAGLFQLGLLLMQMVVGTGIGVYAMLRAERLTGQFVDGVAFGDGARAAGGPIAVGVRYAAGAVRGGVSPPGPSVAGSGPLGSGPAASGPTASGPTPGGENPFGSSLCGGAQEATVLQPGGRFHQ